MYIDEFIDYLKYEKNYSSNTIINYKKDLEEFASFYKNVDLSYNDIRNYIMFLNNNKYTNKSISRHISTLRTYYKFLLKNKLVKNNPMTLISNPKLEKKLPHYLKLEDIELLLKITDTNKKSDIRDNLIIEILYSTGIRVGELVNIKITDINKYNETIKVLGKGNKERIVFINKIVLNKLNKYLSIRDSNSELLFINKRGNQLNERSVRKIFENIIIRNNLKMEFSPHTFRHTFATHMLDYGADIKSVQELLGHVNINTTGIYTHVSSKHLRDVYFKTHPRARG